MFCPQCKCEYIRGATQCSDCGVALVDKLEPESPTIPEDVRIVAVWRGSDPGECEKVAAALGDAKIPYTKANSNNLFGSVPNERMLEIWVSESDKEKADEVVTSWEDSHLPGGLTPEQAAELSLPESDGPDEDNGSMDDLSQEWSEDDPVSEVWTGDAEDVADNLMMCFREIGIASRKRFEANQWSVIVRPGQESRAKEIVREVVEASPPQ
jgi:hypothetical protein